MQKMPSDLEKTVRILCNMAQALKKNNSHLEEKKELLQQAGFNKTLEKGLKNGSLDLKKEEIKAPDLQKIMKKMSDFLEKIQKKST